MAISPGCFRSRVGADHVGGCGGRGGGGTSALKVERRGAGSVRVHVSTLPCRPESRVGHRPTQTRALAPWRAIGGG